LISLAVSGGTLLFSAWIIREISNDTVSLFVAFMALSNVIGLSFSGIQSAAVRHGARRWNPEKKKRPFGIEYQLFAITIALSCLIASTSPLWNGVVGADYTVVLLTAAIPVALGLHSIIYSRMLAAGKLAGFGLFSAAILGTNIGVQVLHSYSAPTSVVSVLLITTTTNIVGGAVGLIYSRRHRIVGGSLFSPVSLKVLFVSLGLAMSMHGDLLFAGLVLSESSRDYYAAGSLLVKAGVFLASALSAVLYRLLLIDGTTREQNKGLTVRGIVITLALSLILVIIGFLFSQELVGLFYGPDWSESAKMLPFLTLAAIPLLLASPAIQFANLHPTLTMASWSALAPIIGIAAVAILGSTPSSLIAFTLFSGLTLASISLPTALGFKTNPGRITKGFLKRR
jgi:O-antigen/teichoic acid export membrane protein